MLLLLAACNGQAHGPASAPPTQPVATRATQQYTCPMHPQIVREAPGQCPVCGMDLVPKVLTGKATAAGEELGTSGQPPNATVLAALATVRPVPGGAAADTLTLPGVVEYDPRQSRAVAARFGGRIERLFVRSSFQPVRRGQKLLELYSPELLSAEQEFVFVLENEATDSPLLAGAREKLRLLGLTESQLRDLARTHRPDSRVVIFSPYDGYVVEMSAPTAATSGTAGAAGSVAELATAPAEEPAAFAPAQLSLTEGAYVATGQMLFQVVNTAQVWGVFHPAPPELVRLQPGQTVRVTANGTVLPPRIAHLDLVEPEFRTGASVAAVRVYLPNPKGQLRRGMRLTATLAATATAPASGFWLPRAAVVDLGTRQVAFMRRGAAFVPVAVQTGQRTARQVQVLTGLTGTEDLAANGHYLIDSEGFVQTAANVSSPASHE